MKVLQTLCTFLVSASFSMAAVAQGVTADEILIGQTGPLSGPIGELGQASSNGAKAYFDHVNEQGGIHGRKIRFIALDDGYNPEKAVENVKQLIDKDQVFSLFGISGTPANIAILPLIAKGNVPNFSPFSGSNAVREPFNRLVFVTAAGYRDEINTIIQHLGVRGIDKVAVVFQNNSFGKEGQADARKAEAAGRIKISAMMSIENDSSDVGKVVAAIEKEKPKAILLLTAGKASIDFIKTYNKTGGHPLYFALSVMASQQAINALGKDGVGVVVSQVVPFPYSATTAVVQEYQKVTKKQGNISPSFGSIGGFIGAKFLVEGLRRTGRDLTRERFINTLETMGKVDFDGSMINFSKTNHIGFPYVDLTVISNDGRFLR